METRSMADILKPCASEHFMVDVFELDTVEEFLERFPDDWDVSMTDNGWC